jgi:hypothetical protein
MKFFFSKILLTLAIAALFPLAACASELRLAAEPSEIHTGEEVTIAVVLDTDAPINAVEGSIMFPADVLALKAVRDGNSSVNLWVEKPHLTAAGVLTFSGITPGGMSGKDIFLFSATFTALRDGTAAIELSGTRALLNDGEGTEASVSVRQATVRIEQGEGSAEESTPTDIVPPEPFAPTIARDPALFGGDSFVVFATQDKDSGVLQYAVKEFRFRPFSFLARYHAAESPYLLRDQQLKSYVQVRASDNAGNIQVAEIAPAHPLAWYEYALYWLTMVGMLCVAGLVFSKILRGNP